MTELSGHYRIIFGSYPITFAFITLSRANCITRLRLARVFIFRLVRGALICSPVCPLIREGSVRSIGNENATRIQYPKNDKRKKERKL